MNRNYFEMHSDYSSNGGSANAPDDILYYQYDKILEMDTLPFSFTLNNYTFNDFISNNLAFPLFSFDVKTIFDQYKETSPPYKCLPATTYSKNKKVSIVYFLMVFKEKPDVLDYNKTRMIDTNDYIYGFFAFEKIKRFSFFPQPRDFDGSLVVCSQLKREIIKKRYYWGFI